MLKKNGNDEKLRSKMCDTIKTSSRETVPKEQSTCLFVGALRINKLLTNFRLCYVRKLFAC